MLFRPVMWMWTWRRYLRPARITQTCHRVNMETRYVEYWYQTITICAQTKCIQRVCILLVQNNDSLYQQTDDMSVDNSTDLKVIATPNALADYTHNVTLNVTGTESLPSKGLSFEWKCSKYSTSLTSSHQLNHNFSNYRG